MWFSKKKLDTCQTISPGIDEFSSRAAVNQRDSLLTENKELKESILRFMQYSSDSAVVQWKHTPYISAFKYYTENLEKRYTLTLEEARIRVYIEKILDERGVKIKTPPKV